MDHLTLPLHRVLIDRNRSQVRVDAPEHEIRVLQAVHAPNIVKIVERDVDEGEFDLSAEAEYDRLTRTYLRTGAANPVTAVFRSPEELRTFGFSPGHAPREQESRALDARKDARKRAKPEARSAA